VAISLLPTLQTSFLQNLGSVSTTAIGRMREKFRREHMMPRLLVFKTALQIQELLVLSGYELLKRE
jgi:hypothetical protein